MYPVSQDNPSSVDCSCVKYCTFSYGGLEMEATVLLLPSHSFVLLAGLLAATV